MNETERIGKMRIIIAENENKFDQMAAWIIIEQMLTKTNSVIGLSTGQTTMNMHKIVNDIYQENPFDTSNVRIFNVDELTNLPRTYPGSCYAMIKSQICVGLNIPEEHFIMPPTFSDDFELECRKFEQAIEEVGGADLQMLGIGWNGHIGINQPGTPFESTTWVSPMDPIFEARVRKETNVDENYPLGGLTLGIKNIMHTRKIVLIAKGKHKAEIIKKAVKGPITIDIPASVLQLHPCCTVLLDADAASMLS